MAPHLSLPRPATHPDSLRVFAEPALCLLPVEGQPQTALGCLRWLEAGGPFLARGDSQEGRLSPCGYRSQYRCRDWCGALPALRRAHSSQLGFAFRHLSAACESALAQPSDESQERQ